MRDARVWRTVEATAVLLFLLQAVRVLFSVLFGLIYDTIFEETVPLPVMGGVLLAVIVAFLSPLAAPRRRAGTVLFGTTVVAALARVAVTFNDPTVRLWGSILLVAAASLYTAVLLQRHADRFPLALVLALAGDQLLRAAGNTFDLSLRSWWWPVQLALAVGVGLVSWWVNRAGTGDQDGRKGRFYGLAVGALLFVEVSLLNFPNGLARWSGVPYEVVAPLLMATTLLVLLDPVRRGMARLLRGVLGTLLLVVLVLAGLTAGRLVGGAVGLVGMLLAQFLLLLMVWGDRGTGRGKGGRPAGLAVGLLLFVALNFAFAFTFTYPYTIPAMRGMGLPVVLLAALIAILPPVRLPQPEARSLKPEVWLPILLIVLLTVVFAWPHQVDWRESGPLRVATYNIHYGYNTPWQLNIEGIGRAIEESGADVVMLQEVDTGRITSYGVDDALWLARRLGMKVVYQPALEGLSGIALLTRYPIVYSDGALLNSELEQTGIVHARLRVGGEEVDAYGVWLGLEPEERARQLDDALSIIGDASPALLGGDMNSTPDSPIYDRLVEAGFSDPFIALGLVPSLTSPSIEPRERIDFVWGRGLTPLDGVVPDALASDHRMVVTEWSVP